MRNPERVTNVWSISACLRCAGLKLLVYGKSMLLTKDENDDEDAYVEMVVEFEDVHLEDREIKENRVQENTKLKESTQEIF